MYFLVCFWTLGLQLPPPAGLSLVFPAIFPTNLQGGNDGAREVIWAFNGTILLSALENWKTKRNINI